jgi:hypothetical protein
MHDIGDVVVERNARLTGTSGAERAIDVLLRHQKGPYQYLTVIECKYWTRRVERTDVDVVFSTMQDVNASKGVIFTTVGFQSGALQYAKSKEIALFKVRDLSDQEWGAPGKLIHFYMQFLSKTVFDLRIHDTKIVILPGQTAPPNISLPITLGKGGSHHPILSEQRIKHATLEDYIEAAARHACKIYREKSLLLCGGIECKRYFCIPVNMPFSPELIVGGASVPIIIPKIEMKVGIRVDQSEFRFDRAEPYHFALAVEDCVTGMVQVASKRKKDDDATWHVIGSQDDASGDALVNGTLLSIELSDFFESNEMDGLPGIELAAVPIRPISGAMDK